MDEKKYRRCQRLIGGFVGGIVGAVVALRNYLGVASIIAITVAATVGIVLEYLCRRKVTEVIEDERIHKISGAASRRTLQIGLLVMAVGGVFLVTLSSIGYPELAIVGWTLVFLGCILLIIYIVLWNYFSKRM